MYQDDEEEFILFIDKIKQLQLDSERAIISGKCNSLDRYKELCGRVKAYSDCAQLSIEFLNKMRSS
jgi:hypothetical protein